MNVRRGVAATAVAAVSLVAATSLVAAGADSAAVPAASTPTTTLPGAPPQLDPLTLFNDVFDRVRVDPENLGDLSSRVVPGSPAAGFFIYLAGFATARLDSRHGPLDSSTATALSSTAGVADTLEVCTTEGYCDVFGRFEVVDGRLRSFQLNGVDIDGRVARPSKAVTLGPVAVRVVGGFERVTVDVLAVVLALGAADDLTVRWEDAAYVGADGAESAVDLAASAFPVELAAGGERYVVLQFPSSRLGGALTLPFGMSAADEVVARVEVDS